MFIVHTSNRMERLADRLADILRRPLPDPLQPELVVVQSRGMQRWISMEIARRNGIGANLHFPFPNALLEMLVEQVPPDRPRTLCLDPETMTFRILMLLPDLLQRAEFAVLERYLENDRDGRKRYRLARRIARLYDQYLIYRPDWIFRWESGGEATDDDERWQGELWRRLVSRGDFDHRAALQRRLLTSLADTSPESSILPPRIGVFGISYLPPFHLQLLAGISHLTDIHFFLFNPCRQYWGDIVSETEAQRLQQRAEKTLGKAVDPRDLHMERGHALLASLGGLGRDFLAMVGETDARIEEDFEEIAVRDCLSGIQSGILNLDSTADQPPEPQPAAGDPSIQIHSCHSPMREIEVLHDRLLAMFEEMPDLQPKDVLVMTPEIDLYTPYIHAVFGSQIEDSRRIPYRIADQSLRRESRTVEAFFELLRMRNSRFGATDVLGLLESVEIRQRFELTERDMDRIERWVRDLNIRWGIDAEERRERGLPGFTENTWQAGIERMLLGLALPGRGRRMFAGILPYDGIEGESNRSLGLFLDFLQALFSWRRRLAGPRTPVQWQQDLLALLEAFFRVDETSEPDLQAIRDALEMLGAMEQQAGHRLPLPVEVAEAFLEETLQQSRRLSGFISGGVTFCALLPMRSIPFPVVALVGMNHDSFPREDRPPAFDRMARRPRRGDRSRRTDDRYLFLEALLSARRRFYISYVGQSIQDNSEIPPAVPVSELIDVMRNDCRRGADAAALKHPLQAFSPRYFNPQQTQLFSYAQENCVAIREGRRKPSPFFDSPLAEPAEELCRIDLEELCRFFSNPCRFLVRRRLGIRLDDPDTLPEDRENFRLDPLDRYRLGNAITRDRLEGIDTETVYQLRKADGLLPPGNVGRFHFGEIQAQAAALADKVATAAGSAPGAMREWSGSFSGVAVSGRLQGLHANGRLQFRFARLRASDLLSAWIRHLVLGLVPDRPCPAVTLLIGNDGARRFHAPLDPEEHLGALLAIYRQGLCRPLPFFPDLSLDCVEQIHDRGRDPQTALRRARKRWAGNPYQRGVADDPYYGLCFRHTDPIGDDFLQSAERIFGPLRRHVETLVLVD